jgi:hypothetical protein
LRAVVEEVGQGCAARRLAGNALGIFAVALAGQKLRPHAPPADVLVSDAGRRASLGELRQPLSL